MPLQNQNYGTQSSYQFPEETPYYCTQPPYQSQGEGDEDGCDAEKIHESPVSYQTDEYFASREELETWVRNRGVDNGCVIVVERSRTHSVHWQCNRGGEHISKAKVRNTRTIKKGCPFKLQGRYDWSSDSWKLTVINETHNHDPFMFKEGHAYLRRLNDEQKDVVARLYRQGLRPEEILPVIREEFPESCCVLKDIHNYLRRVKDAAKIGKTPMQVLDNFLQSNGFTCYTFENAKSNRTERIFFIHSRSHRMWRAFPHILLIDTTYSTNMYNWPFMQFIGVTSTMKSFCIAHAFISRERQNDFTWVLERLKGTLQDCVEPRVIITDRDKALIKSCDIVFPNATKKPVSVAHTGKYYKKVEEHLQN